MALKQQIDSDLKQALLSGDKELVSILRGLKSAILYEEVSASKREAGLSDAEVVAVLQKEAKKRKESATLYEKAGEQERTAKERQELTVIERYLPEMMSDEALQALIDEVMAEFGQVDKNQMGMVIGKVKAKSQGRADGAKIAQLVKERLSS